MPSIILTKNETGWQADFHQADDAREIFALFGTYILPTAFTALASVKMVRDAVANKNPGHEILIGGDK